MIENFDKIISAETGGPEVMDKLLKEHLNIGLSDCTQALSNSLSERAEELLEDIMNLAPYGDYDKLTEDPQVMLSFLKEESCKQENWIIDFVEVEKKGDKLLKLTFLNKSVDDGDILKGFVFLGLSGVIRHAFTQVHS